MEQTEVLICHLMGLVCLRDLFSSRDIPAVDELAVYSDRFCNMACLPAMAFRSAS